MQLAALEVRAVDVGDLELPAGRRLEPGRDVDDPVVVEVEPGHREARARLGRLLLDLPRAAVGAERHHPVARGIAHPVGEHGGPGRARDRGLERHRQVVPVEDVVAQGQGHRVLADELAADDEGLGQPLGPGLHRVGDGQAEVLAVPEEPVERGRVLGGGDQEDLPDARQHEGGQRVVHHRLVVDGHQLLADPPGRGVEPRAGPTRQDDSLHHVILSGPASSPPRFFQPAGYGRSKPVVPSRPPTFPRR